LLKYLLPAILFCNAALAAETYDVRFSGRFDPDAERFEAAIEVQQSRRELRVLDFSAPEARFSEFRGDGVIERRGKRLVWALPPAGGRLEYVVKVDHRRGGSFDARLAPGWAVLRLDDVFPAARVVALKGRESRSTLELKGPRGWSFESRYGPVHKPIAVDNPERRFDRPTGWLAAGRLGIRRERIGKQRITVAAPQEHDLRRLDIIAFLRWTLPKLTRVFPDFPVRLLIVGARDDMWRGGLSGPGSVYLHSERPLISENGTSTLLHELIHIATGSLRGPREDWIVEGLAEYYSLEILRRSGGLSPERYQRAFDRLAEWTQRENGALRSPSTGADTARAALLFRDLQAELEAADAGSLDSVARRLLRRKAIDADALEALLEDALGGPSATLQRALD
jgi:hypothetical protein